MQQRLNYSNSSLGSDRDAARNNVVINMEGKKIKFISHSDDLCIQAILATDTTRIVNFSADYPLSPVILSLKKIIEDSDLYNPDTIDTAIKSHINNLDNLLSDALLKFQKNDKITIRGNEIGETLINALELMNELIDDGIQKTSNVKEVRHKLMNELALKSQNLILNFLLDFKKMSVMKNKKSKLNETINDFIVNNLASLSEVYLYSGCFHQAEIYTVHAVTLLAEMKNRERVHQLAFPIKLCMAKIYFEFGYFEATLNLILESQEMIKKKYILNFDATFFSLIIFLTDQFLPFYKNSLVVLEVCQNTLILLNIVIQKDPRLSTHITSVSQAIKIIFSKTQEKYLTELTAAMRGSSAIKKMISKIQHDFNKHHLMIMPKTPEYAQALSHALRSFDLKTEIISGQSIKVDLYCCSPKLLAQVCEKSLATLERETTLARQHAEAKLKLSQIEPMRVEKPSSEQTTNMTFFSEKKQTTTSSIQSSQESNQSVTASTKSIEKYSDPVNTSNNSSEKPFISYHWQKTGLTYNSKEGNQGTVKMLASEDRNIPNGVYFGYMPEYILDDEHYHSGFATKLTSGKIDKQCIRWITKEMQTLGKSECFLFKIVISRRDPRVYGWIEDTYTDADGKQHFLVCFGLMSNHKLKDLPTNPQKIK
jgi:hypothetical protein